MPRRVDLDRLGIAGTRRCIRDVCKHCEHSTSHTRDGLLRVSLASGAHSTLRCTPAGVPETASNELAMSLAGIGESSKAFMISNRAERIERALVGDKAFRRSLICHTSLVRAHHIVLCAYKSPCLGRSTRDGRIANGRARASNVAWLGSRRAIHLGWAHGTPRDDQCQRQSPKTRSDISDINE